MLAVGARNCILIFEISSDFFDAEKALDLAYGTEDGRTIEQKHCLLLL